MLFTAKATLMSPASVQYVDVDTVQVTSIHAVAKCEQIKTVPDKIFLYICSRGV